MRTRRLLDREIERLLAGVPVEDRDLALLTPLVGGLRSLAAQQPPETEVRNVAARAAAVVLERSQHLTDAAASHRRQQRVGLTPRLAAVILAVLMVPAMTGAALAADSAIPGDPLYGLDRAFEAVGIGAGSTGERLTEAAQLADDDRTDEAIDHAIMALGSGDDIANEMALRALEDLTGLLTVAAVDRSEVIALLEYISENVGQGVGADGREFGQGVAELAREVGSGQVPDAPGSGSEQPNSPAPDPSGPPAESPGQGQGPPAEPGNSNGNSAQNGDGQNSGTGQNGNAANQNGNGDPGPPVDSGAASPPGGPSGNESTVDSNTVAPESGGDDADEASGGNGQGPNSDSPSVTAPSRDGRP